VTEPTRRRRSRSAGLGAIASGLALCGSLPPFGWWPLAFVGLVGLDRLVADQPMRTRFARGFLVALALYIPSLLWMQSLTLPGYFIACGLYAAMLGIGIALAPGDRGRWFVLAGTWTVVELVRWSWPFGGVPLSNLAIGQAAGPLAGVARVGGMALLVTLTVVGGQAAAAAVRRQWRPAGVLAAVVALSVVAAGFAPHGHHVGTAEVAAVQGGGPQGTRKTDTSVIEVFDRHVEATDGVRGRPDLIVWPEDVIDTPRDFASDPWATIVGALARRFDAPMVVGTVEGASDTRFRNAAVLVDAEGVVVARYDKVHRVPFGEYVPFRGLLEQFAEDALPARDALIGDLPAHLDVPGRVGRVGVAISWEIFFPDRSREGIEDGGRLLLNPTNGSSFSGTTVQSQQVASSRLRAIENGRWVVQVAPTGFSAVIDEHGRVLDRTAVGEERVLQQSVQLREGLTIYTRVGNFPAVLLALVLILVGASVSRRRRQLGPTFE
jgi:apolipoprotein N-acyltransferase